MGIGSMKLVATPTKSSKVAAPFFIIPDQKDLLFWVEAGTGQTLYATKKIRKSEEHVLLALAELGTSSWDSLISADQILPILIRKNPNTATSTLKNRIGKVAAKLTDLGIFTRHSRSITTTRRQFCYELNKPQKVMDEIEKELSQTIAKASGKKKDTIAQKRSRQKALQASLIQRTDLIYPAGVQIKNDQAWSQLLISQLISRASRETQRDPREMIESKIQLGSELIDIVAYTTTRGDEDIGGKPGLITASDAQIFMAVITIVSQFIDHTVKEGKPLVNRIPIDVVEIVKLLGLADAGTNRNRVVKAMNRMIYTGYTLKIPRGSKASQALSALGVGHNVSEVDMSIFRDAVVGIEGEESETEAPNRRWFTLSLNTYIWEMVRSGALTRMVHPGLLRQKDVITHKLHAHLKLYCAGGQKVKLDTNMLFRMFEYKSGIVKFKSALKKTLLAAGGHSSDMEIPEQGVFVNFYGFGLNVAVDPYSKGALIIEAWEMEEEQQREEEEQALIDARNSSAKEVKQLNMFSDIG